jgi:hypothetical protein
MVSCDVLIIPLSKLRIEWVFIEMSLVLFAKIIYKKRDMNLLPKSVLRPLDLPKNNTPDWEDKLDNLGDKTIANKYD